MNLLWIINNFIIIAIIAFITLEYLNKDYPNREKIRTAVRKYIDLVLNKLHIKLDDNYKNYTLFVIPAILYVITAIVTNIYVKSQVDNYKKDIQDTIKQVQNNPEEAAKKYEDMIKNKQNNK